MKKEYKNLKMEMFMKENFYMIWCMAKELILVKMVPLLLDNLLKIILLEAVLLNTNKKIKKQYVQETLLMVRWMEIAKFNTKMVIYFKEK